jgi:hypothetical protein
MVQLTTDGHNAYLNAVNKVFGIAVDYAQLVKSYARSGKSRSASALAKTKSLAISTATTECSCRASRG